MSKKLSRELIAQKVKSDRIESIRNLNLWGSNIEDISIIEEMPSLEIVSLSVNKIRTLRPFANLQNLRELYLRQNLISNLNEIKYLTDCQNLTVLWLSQNPICDNPNYRAVVICVLPQLQKLDDIAITDAERLKAEKKLSGNFEEDDEEEQEIPKNQKNYQENEVEDYSSNKKSGGYQEQKRKGGYYQQQSNKKEYDEEENYYGNKNQNQIQKNKNKYGNKYEEKEEYLKPKKTFQPERSKQNDDYDNYDNENDDNKYNNYDNRPIRAASGAVKNYNYKKQNNYNNYDDKYENNYDDKNRKDKKRGNSNVLNAVINLLKELSTNELQIVKREIDRINNY